MNLRITKVLVLWSVALIAPCSWAMFKFDEENENVLAHDLYDLSHRPNAQVINMPDRAGKTLLAYALEVGSLPIINNLLQEGADPNHPMNGKSPLLYAVQECSHEIVDTLLLFGARDGDAHELFHEAIKRRSKHIIHSLVRTGFDINARAADNGFALIDAVLGKDSDVIEICLRLGANPEMRDGEDRTALELLQHLQKKRKGLTYSREHLRDIGDPIVDDPGMMSRASDAEIIKLLQQDTQNLELVKEHASRMSSMPMDVAQEYFAELDRATQKKVAMFVPLHLRDRLKNSVPKHDNSSSGCWIQ